MIIEKLQNDRKEIHKEFELSWNGSTASRVCFKGYSSKSASGEMRLCFLIARPLSAQIRAQSIFFTFLNLPSLHPKTFNDEPFFVLFNSLWIYVRTRVELS